MSSAHPAGPTELWSFDSWFLGVGIYVVGWLVVGCRLLVVRCLLLVVVWFVVGFRPNRPTTESPTHQ